MNDFRTDLYEDTQIFDKESWRQVLSPNAQDSWEDLETNREEVTHMMELCNNIKVLEKKPSQQQSPNQYILVHLQPVFENLLRDYLELNKGIKRSFIMTRTLLKSFRSQIFTLQDFKNKKKEFGTNFYKKIHMELYERLCQLSSIFSLSGMKKNGVKLLQTKDFLKMDIYGALHYYDCVLSSLEKKLELLFSMEIIIEKLSDNTTI